MNKSFEVKKNSQITVLLPIHNEKKEFLKDSIESLINQSYDNWKCLIIYEGEKKENIVFMNEILKKDKRFKLIIPNQKLGLAGSLNLGLSLSDTEYIARFDSDDIMLKDRLKIQLQFLEKNKSISVVGSNLFVINEKNEKIKLRKYPKQGRKLFFYFSYRCGLAHPSTMFRLKSVQKVGMYNPELTGAEDLDLWLRILKNGFSIYNIQEPLLLYRQNFSRSTNHWSNVYKVRKENSGIFIIFPEKLILLCIKLILLIRSLKIDF